MSLYKRVAVIILVFLPLLAFGQAKVGTTGLNFLKVGVGARAMSMGSAFTAVSNDASALYYNPGGLVQLTKPEAVFTLIEYPAEIRLAYLGATFPTRATSGVVGVQITSLFTDEMIETTPERPYGTGRTFSASEMAIGLTYCQRLTEKFSVGATMKYLNSSLADVTANGWSADVGTFYTTGWKRINIGMIIQNFGPDLQYVDTPFPLPQMFKFGVSSVVWENASYSVLVAGEFVHPADNLEVYHFGAEFTAMKMFSLRIGKQVNGWKRGSWDEYQKDRQKDPFLEYPLLDEDGMLSFDGASVGLGVNVPEVGIKVDYAYAGMGTLGAAHRFTLGYSLAGLIR